jgi:hypothetical protein
VGWGDRLIGLAVGAIVGAAAALLTAALFTYLMPLPRGLALDVARGIGLVGIIWGWFHGAYQLGRLVGRVRRRLSPPRQ